MTEKGAFKTEGDAVRAVHLIQYLVTGSNETPEYELLLNKNVVLGSVSTSLVGRKKLTYSDITGHCFATFNAFK